MTKPKKKTAKKKVAKKKDPSKSKAAQAKNKNDAVKKERKGSNTPGKLMDTLLLERKYTDEQIMEKVNKAFPGKKIPATYLNNHRWNLNNLAHYGKNTSAKDKPLEKLVMYEDKLVVKSVVPKPERKAQKKYTKENDPLLKKAGINVHDKKEEKKAAPKKKATPKKKAVKKVLKKSTKSTS